MVDTHNTSDGATEGQYYANTHYAIGQRLNYNSFIRPISMH